MIFIDAITEKNTRSTVSLTAGRGRVRSTYDLLIVLFVWLFK